MFTSTLKISILCILVRLSSTLLSTPYIIERDGYPVENHTAQTSDGYILKMHRIPYSPKLNNTDSRRPVAFLMHGLLSASSIWVLKGADRALAFLLSDAGYDVWMGNARGNVYSKNHVTRSPLTQKFWDFSWHEIGIYDIPAMIDYALNVTGEKQVYYFGHSQGCTSFFVLVGMLPNYQERIHSAYLLSPVAFVNNAITPLFSIGAPLVGYPNIFPELFGSTEFLPSSRALELLGTATCRDEAVTQDLCSNAYFLIYGYDSPFLNETMLPEISNIIPAGSSVNQVLHYLQNVNSAKFRQFDYGALRNVLVYGSINPPDYKLENLVVPTYMYYGDNDYFNNITDVNRLINILEKETNALKSAYLIPYHGWNHADFLFGIGVEDILYKIILNNVSES